LLLVFPDYGYAGVDKGALRSTALGMPFRGRLSLSLLEFGFIGLLETARSYTFSTLKY
jgi:hypothetical protein